MGLCLSTKHEEQGERVYVGLCLSTQHEEQGERVYGELVSRRSMSNKDSGIFRDFVICLFG